MINTIVGENTLLKGNFEIDGILKIDGNFEGSVKGHSQLLIGEHANVSVNFEGEEIIIGGSVIGKIQVSGKAVLLSTSKVNAEIIASKIIIEPGAKPFGQFKMKQLKK